MAFGFSDLTSEGKAYFAKLERLEDRKICVGYQNGETEKDGTSIAEIAAANELGSSNVPARPFMKQAWENHEDKLQQFCDELNETLASGGDLQKALEVMGNELVGLVQEEFRIGNFAPNSPVTIARKNSSQPLIDTGTMRDSVHFQIK